MTDVYAAIGTRGREIPQAERAEKSQIKNNAGGYVFKLSDEQMLRRFLILGTDGGTYYASAKAHTAKAAEVVQRMADAGDMALVDQILDVSLNGLAPKQDPTLLALAIACASKDDALRAAALDAVPKVCRTFTMLTTFLKYVKTHRGMGRGLKKAIAKFYEERTADQVALQMVKYRQRHGYTHRDVLRIAHPIAMTDAHKALYDYACGRVTNDAYPLLGALPEKITVFEDVQRADAPAPVTAGIRHANLPWEAVPDAFINNASVLDALLPGMGATALLRQLPRFARAGMTGGLKPSATTQAIVDKLTDAEFIKRGRLHPYQVLLARVVYASSGRPVGYRYDTRRNRGEPYSPNGQIISALEHAYELSFENITPSDTATGVFLDVSGSMGNAFIGDSPLSARDASAAMAMVTLRSEPYTVVGGFTAKSGRSAWRDSGVISRLDLTARDSLTSAIEKVSGLPFGGTDCALPMKWALENEPTIETFIVYTDNETWAGGEHPHRALKTYREKTGINAKLIVVGMTATGFSIADPADPGMMDVVGFDASAPRVMAEFAAGTL